MHQYEVHGSTRVCILISRSEALLRRTLWERPRSEVFRVGEWHIFCSTPLILAGNFLWLCWFYFSESAALNFEPSRFFPYLPSLCMQSMNAFWRAQVLQVLRLLNPSRRLHAPNLGLLSDHGSFPCWVYVLKSRPLCSVSQAAASLSDFVAGSSSLQTNGHLT